MNVTIVLDLHRLAVVLTLRMATTIIVPLHLATTRLVPAMMDIVAAARLVTMMNTLVMITAIDPHLPCVLAAGRPLKIPTHLLVEAMIAICTRLHLQDVPTMTPTPRMDMVVPGRGARLQGAMADTKGVHVTGDCSSLPHPYSLISWRAVDVFSTKKDSGVGLIRSEHFSVISHQSSLTTHRAMEEARIGWSLAQGCGFSA